MRKTLDKQKQSVLVLAFALDTALRRMKRPDVHETYSPGTGNTVNLRFTKVEPQMWRVVDAVTPTCELAVIEHAI